MENQSVESRVISITGNLEVVIQHPLTGVGLNQADVALREYGYYINQTNTVMSYFATFGVLIGALYVLAGGSFLKSISHSTMEFAALIISFLLIFSGEDFIQSLFFNILMMYGWIRLFDYRLWGGKRLKGALNNEGKRE